MPKLAIRPIFISLIAALALLTCAAGSALAASKDRGDKGSEAPHSCVKVERKH